MDTFCVLPWYSKEFRKKSVIPCCIMQQDADLNLVKTELLNGIQTSACTNCWTLENNGKKSRRQFENEFLDYKLNRDLELIRQDCINSLQVEPLVYQIVTSNLCNQACVTCSSSESSKWAEIEKKIGIVPSKLFKINSDSLDINYSTAQRISLLGGEPLFDPRTFEILEKLIRCNNIDCHISIVTNGSINLKQEQLDLLSKFTDLNICISVDGIGPVFEYMRWPTKWNTLLGNLKQYNTVTKNISVSYTISSMNAMYYNETIEWFTNNNLRYNHNIVSFPSWLSLKNMPVNFKDQLSKNKNFISNYCNLTGEEISLEMIKSQIVNQDQAKKINICNYMPEVADLLGII